MEERALWVRNLTKQYRNFRLDDVSFFLPSGCIMGLIGENGAGKSTLIKSILGAVRPESGQIEVLGCDNKSADFIGLKEQIGVVLDEACFPAGLTAVQMERMLGGIYKNWEKETFLEYLKRFGLLSDKLFKDYSRGMKMQLSIAAALSHHARLLVLDEPTGGLDPIVRDEILDVFNEFTRDPQCSILISSHIISDLERICDYIAFLHHGKLLFCEEKDVLLERYGLVSLRREDFEALEKDAVLSAHDTGYGVEALVRRDRIPAGMKPEYAGIERIIVALAKEERR